MWIQTRLLLYAAWSGSTLFVGKASKTFQQTTKADDFNVIGVFRVNTDLLTIFKEIFYIVCRKYVFIHTVQLFSGSISINFRLEHLSIPLSMPVSSECSGNTTRIRPRSGRLEKKNKIFLHLEKFLIVWNCCYLFIFFFCHLCDICKQQV